MIIPQDNITKAEELLKTGEGTNPFIVKMMRLKADLQTFKEDLAFLNSSTKPPVIIYACDYTEVRAYQKPEDHLIRYLYDVEETAELTPLKKGFNEKKYNDKVIKRWYRLRELFFNSKIPIIIFPSHMREVEDDILYLTQVLDEPSIKLSEIVHLVKSKQVSETDLNLAKVAIRKVENGDNLTDEEAESLSEFFKFVSSNLASRTFEKKVEAGTRLERLSFLLSRGNIEGIDSFPWEREAGINAETGEEIRCINLNNLSSEIDKLDYLFSLYGNRSSHANYVDAQALVYVREINSILKKNGFDNVRMQLVSSSLSMFRIERAILGEQESAWVRHPKILGSLLNVRESIWQQVQEDHACIIDALDVYLDRLKHGNFNSSQVKQLRHQISEAWQRIESVIFAKEIEENLERKEQNNKVLLSDIKKDKRFEILNYLREKGDKLDKYIHTTYKLVLKDLVDYYVSKLSDQPLNDITAYYFNDVSSQPAVLRIRLHSNNVRSIFELTDQKIIAYLSKSDGKQKFGKMIATLLSSKDFSKQPELKLIKALIMAVFGKWQMVIVICNHALEDKFDALYPYQEILFLRHLAHRALAFECRKIDCSYKGTDHFKHADDDLQTLLEKNGSDLRFNLSSAGMTLERLCFPELFPGSTAATTIHEQIMHCEKIESIVCDHLSDPYSRYMFIRVYQIKLSYYIAVKTGMVRDSHDTISDDMAKLWYDKVCGLELTGEFRGLEIIRHAGRLLFYFDETTQVESLADLETIAVNSRKLTKNGFFRDVSGELIRFLGGKISSKFPEAEIFVKTLYASIDI